MLQLQPARSGKTSARRIGIAIAGGGPIGGMYELGTLRALEESIEGLDLTALDVYVGVSSGAFLAAGLANRMDTAAMTRVFITGDRNDVQFRPDAFVRPAVWEYTRRAMSLPRHLFRWWRDVLFDPGSANLNAALSRLGALIPSGLFDNDQIERFLADAFSRHGRTNDFRELRRKLYVVAVDLDNGEAVRFGERDWDDIPISRAVQASSALPGLYPPVSIRNRQFVDGALRRTMHASIVLEEGVDLLIGINPLVPFDASMARAQGKTPESIVEGGLPVVLSQTFRTLLQSRVQVGMAKYAHQYRDVDQLLLEPNTDDAEMFFTSVFSYKSRRRVCNHAYQSTLADLRQRRALLAPMLARHGLGFRDEVLDDLQREVFDGLAAQPRRHTTTTARLRRALDDVEVLVKHRSRQAKAQRRG